jgi:hypothetical protein
MLMSDSRAQGWCSLSLQSESLGYPVVPKAHGTRSIETPEQWAEAGSVNEILIGYHLVSFHRLLQCTHPISFLNTHSNQRQPQRRQHTSPNDRPPRHNHLLIRNPRPRIPHQMPQPIQRVKRKRQRIKQLQTQLHQRRERGEGSGDGVRVQMPAEGGGDEVRNAEEIHGA